VEATVRVWTFVFVIVLVNAIASHAGVNTWTSNGPYGGTFSEFAFDSANSNVIIASTKQDAFYTRPDFRTVNGAATWQRTVFSPDCTDEKSCFEGLVKADPFHPHSFFASSFTSGFVHSADAGKTWQNVGNCGAFCEGLSDFEVSSQNRNVIYGVATLRPPQISKSTDGGITWKLSSHLYAGFPSDVAHIEIDSSNSQRVYALSEGGKGLRTENGGKTWKPMNHGNPVSPVAYAMVADPVKPKTLYVGGNKGILKSTDAGESWVTLPCGCRYITSLAVDRRNPQLMWATGWQSFPLVGGIIGDGGRVYKSTDGGMTWETFEALESALWNYYGVAIDPRNSNRVFLGTGGRGVFRTPDGGATWQTINKGIDDRFISRIESGARPGEVYAGGFLTVDAGSIWHWIMNSTTQVLIGDVKLHGKDPNLIVLAGSFPNALAVSTDTGHTWQKRGPISSFYSERVVESLDPEDSDTIYFTFSNDGTTRHLARSTDLGLTWTVVDAGITQHYALSALEISSALPTTIYAGTQVGTLYSSTDRGKTWKNRSNGLDRCGDTWIDCDGLVQIRTSPVNPNLLLVSDFEKLYRSVDGGLTWTKPTVPNVRDVRFSPSKPSEAIAVGTFGEIFISSDAGATWKEFTNRAGLTGNTGWGEHPNPLVGPHHDFCRNGQRRLQPYAKISEDDAVLITAVDCLLRIRLGQQDPRRVYNFIGTRKGSVDRI
jgi:photosystem II stability/assembly factor-like uncharacterized protein